jgi:hypothetical protein
MSISTKIALSVSAAGRSDQYFSLRLKQSMINEPAEYQRPGKIFAISDIEGNFQTLCKLLLRAKVIDKQLKWTFDDNHLVIAGDCFDRGEQVTECLWLIYSLEEKARKKGGYVHFILGNHEIMNMNGDWRYVHPKYAQSSRVRYTALYNGNNELWRWLRTKNIIEKIGDVLFVHGGFAEELIQFNLSVTEINELVRPYYTHANELFEDPFLSVIYNSQNSPFWYRGYYQENATEEQVDRVLKYFGVKTIITGHTLTTEIGAYFNGKVINIDTDHAGGNSEGLLINRDRFYRVTADGRRIRLK